MELIPLPEWLMWIRAMPWYLFFPTAFIISIITAYPLTLVFMKWLELAFGFRDSPSPSTKEEEAI